VENLAILFVLRPDSVTAPARLAPVIFPEGLVFECYLLNVNLYTVTAVLWPVFTRIIIYHKPSTAIRLHVGVGEDVVCEQLRWIVQGVVQHNPVLHVRCRLVGGVILEDDLHSTARNAHVYFVNGYWALAKGSDR